MPRDQVNLRLPGAEIAALDQLADALNLTRAETVRFALRHLRESDPVQRRNRFAASLRARFGREAALKIELDDAFAPVASVDGRVVPDLYVPAQATRFGDEDYVQIWIGDPATDDVRIFLGVLPARSGVPLVIPLAEMSAGIRPRAAAWFVDA